MTTHVPQIRSGKVARAATDVAAGLVVLALPATATWVLLSLPATYLLQALSLYGIIGTLILTRLPNALPGPGLGNANRVTLLRSTLVVCLTPLVVYPSVHVGGGPWWIILAAGAALVLDGVDGWVARRTQGHSAFGARFDMELDAFLILVLTVLVWQGGKAGPWVLLIGSLRYLFVAAGWAWPSLRADLPPSPRRKAICVVQGIALLVCLGPIIAPSFSYPIAALALGLLVYSFGKDVLWLLGDQGYPTFSVGEEREPPQASRQTYPAA